MARIPVPLGPDTDGAKSRQGGGATLINCYVEKTEGGKTGFSVNTRPRLKAFSDTGLSSGFRGGIDANNAIYGVCGEKLVKIGSGGAVTVIGTVLGFRPVTMSVNRHVPLQITITSDTKSYSCENDVLTEITDGDLPTGVTSNCYINGRTVYGLNDGSHYWSDDNDCTAIDALNFAEAEREADEGVRVFTVGEDFWHFGARTREIIRYTGNADSLFEPLTGAGQGEGDGCAAKNSVTSVNGVIYWVNDLFKVVASTGGKAQPVSNHAVSRDIQSALASGNNDDILGYAVSTEGHDFYYLRSPFWCWVLDTATGLWSKAKSYGSDTFRCGFSVKAFNKTILLDATDGKVYEFTDTVENDDTSPCIAQIITSPLNAFPDGYTCHALHVDVQRGVGLATGVDSVTEPELVLNVSRDGGMIYGNDHKRGMGRMGEYSKALRFNRLGSTNGTGMTFKLTMSTPVVRAVFQAVADVSPLRG